MAKTPSENWNSQLLQYRKKCQSIIQISKKIRYAGVINVYGRTLTGIVQPGIKPLLKSEQVKNEFFIISTLVSLRTGVDASIGKLDHVILQHQKVTVILLQKKNVTYYVSVNKNEKNLEKILSQIKKLI
jgi:hypothetical protein